MIAKAESKSDSEEARRHGVKIGDYLKNKERVQRPPIVKDYTGECGYT